MKHAFISFCALGAASLLPLGAAHAAPIQPTAKVANEVIEVRGFCGLGRHRGPWGGCLPNGYYRYPAYAYAAPVYHCWWRPGPWGPVRVCGW